MSEEILKAVCQAE